MHSLVVKEKIDVIGDLMEMDLKEEILMWRELKVIATREDNIFKNIQKRLCNKRGKHYARDCQFRKRVV